MIITHSLKIPLNLT